MPADPVNILEEPSEPVPSYQRPLFPTVLLVSGTAILLLVLVLVVPKFEKVFADVGSDLPSGTKFLMTLSRWIGGRLYPDQFIPGLFWLAVLLPGLLWGSLSLLWMAKQADDPILVSPRATPWIWAALGAAAAFIAVTMLVPLYKLGVPIT